MSSVSESSAPPAGLRSRKKAARREALIDATHLLVEREGLDGATVEAICAEAGVSTRTFFNYFASKDDAVLGIEPWAMDPAVADAFAAGGPTGHLMTDLEVLVTWLLDKPMIGKDRIARVMALAQHEPRLLLAQVAWMEKSRGEVEALIRRRLGPDVPADRVELIGILVMVLTRSAFVRWEATGGEGGAQDQLAGVVHDLRGLLAET
ncbi:TetR/AcrR family transcriptional regulator [Pengzhenrongella frigida]|uniref:TetR/AcrR family transcriptional regulator n=1 Tax=Pengzhenrongella frigida TaxID=1259133 RepID=A0A4Q5N116_9MICO|nr:TetR/AcrR family transcriptional regulator [Cellulomonas sp. HLT2-17]RYV51759.1 TetR/AcrR family transcriptional regulator [Cellulomonas sp. HLT2-17]